MSGRKEDKGDVIRNASHGNYSNLWDVKYLELYCDFSGAYSLFDILII